MWKHHFTEHSLCPVGPECPYGKDVTDGMKKRVGKKDRVKERTKEREGKKERRIERTKDRQTDRKEEKDK